LNADRTIGEVLVDARWLEPPEPMERVLAALELLRPGGQVRFLIHREPQPLYSILNDAGYPYQVEPMADGCYQLLIRRQAKSSG
jgi:uncharacterized protein (DUF2249 family)